MKRGKDHVAASFTRFLRKSTMKIVDMLILALMDLVESATVFVSVFFAYPLIAISHIDRIVKLFAQMIFLLKHGLLALRFRFRLAQMFEDSEQAAAILLSILKALEDQHKLTPTRTILKDTLTEFYTILARSYLRNGRLDDAASVIQRAYRVLGVEYLPGLHRFDIRLAQIAKAGVAAARLLESGGFATLMVERPKTSDSSNNRGSHISKAPYPRHRFGRISGAIKGVESSLHSNGAKVIPFRPSHQ